MKSIKLVFLYGFLIWLIPFIVSFIIFPIHENDRTLFESIMPVVLTISTVLFSILYLKKVETKFLKEGILLGVIWFLISFIIDQFLFSAGPHENEFYRLYKRYRTYLFDHSHRHNRIRLSPCN